MGAAAVRRLRRAASGRSGGGTRRRGSGGGAPASGARGPGRRAAAGRAAGSPRRRRRTARTTPSACPASRTNGWASSRRATSSPEPLTPIVTTSPAICALELVRGALGDDPAVVDDREAVAQRVGLVEVVGGEEHAWCRSRAGGGPRPTSGLAPADRDRSSARRGTAGPGDGPCRARRPAVGACRPSSCRSRGRRPPSGPPHRAARARACATAVERPNSRPCITSSPRPDIRGSEPPLCATYPIRRRTSSGFVGDIQAHDAGDAAGGRQQRGEHPQRGRLARAVGPEEAEDRSRIDAELDARDGLDRARPCRTSGAGPGLDDGSLMRSASRAA